MTGNDTLSSALSSIFNSEKISRSEVTLFPSSKTIKETLSVMKENGFVGDFKEVNDSKGKYLVITLLGRINKCGAIKPRFSVTMDEY